MKKLPLILTATLILSACVHKPQDFASQIRAIEKKAHSDVGISAVHLESGSKLEYKAEQKFKMASTMKVPVAIYLLDRVQRNKISLEKMVRIKPYDLVPGTGLMGYYMTRPGLAMSVYNMLEPMITISDNSATDIIISMVGGPKVIQDFLSKNGIRDMRIDRPLMQQFIDCKGLTGYTPPKKEWSLQRWKQIFDAQDKQYLAQSYRQHFSDELDTTTPHAMTELLTKLYRGELLNKENTALILEIMGRTASGENRIKQGLPNDTIIAHKTGSWNQKQLDAFYNYTHDVGIITIPEGGGHIVISIYTGSHEGSTQSLQSEAIARAAKVVYDQLKRRNT